MILEDVQSMTPGNLITLYEIDCRSIGGDVERYHAHNDGIITWQGKQYYPWPIKASDFERTGSSQQPNPTLSVANVGEIDGEQVTGVVSALCLALDDLRGATLTRKRTFAKYLDAVNFGGNNPTADPTEHFPDERWIISQKQSETRELVTFVLSSPLQVNDQQLPSREIIANVCGWLVKAGPNGGYRGAWCGYTGSRMFDINGNPVSDPALDRCGGRVSDCKKRFGQYAVINFGGFPSADRVR